MAEAEDEGTKTGSDQPSKPVGVPSSIEHRPGSPSSEWTASDARGPLAAAEESGAPVENFGSAEPTETPTHSQPEAERAAIPHEAADEPVAPGATLREAPPASRWPIVGALLASAAIGAIVAMIVDRNQSRGADAQVASLSAKVDALEARKPAEPDLGPIRQQIAVLQGQVADARKAAAPGKSGGDSAALEQKIAALQSSQQALQAQGSAAKDADAKLGQLQSAVDGLKQQVATTASDVQGLKDQQKTLSGKVGAPALAIVADSLVQAIRSGQPYALQVDVLSALGAEASKLAVLRQAAATGIASPSVLAAKLAPLEEPMLATAHKPPPNATFVQKLESGISSLVSVRRTGDVGGTDASSLVARIKADLTHDDLNDAAKAWNSLPADAKAKSDAWGALLTQSAASLAAARSLQSEAIVALGGKKS